MNERGITSLQLARALNREHKNVLRMIRNDGLYRKFLERGLIESWTRTLENGVEAPFYVLDQWVVLYYLMRSPRIPASVRLTAFEQMSARSSDDRLQARIQELQRQIVALRQVKQETWTFSIRSVVDWVKIKLSF